MKIQDFKEESKKYGIGGGNIFNLRAGENKFRLLTELEPYIQHYVKAENKYTDCDGAACAQCKTKASRSCRVLAYILDREDNKIKLAKLPWAVFTCLGDLSISTEWGFTNLPPYDLLVVKQGEGKATRYSVNATRNEVPLSSDIMEELKSKKPIAEVVASWKARNSSSPAPSINDAPQEELPWEQI